MLLQHFNDQYWQVNNSLSIWYCTSMHLHPVSTFIINIALSALGVRRRVVETEAEAWHFGKHRICKSQAFSERDWVFLKRAQQFQKCSKSLLNGSLKLQKFVGRKQQEHFLEIGWKFWRVEKVSANSMTLLVKENNTERKETCISQNYIFEVLCESCKFWVLRKLGICFQKNSEASSPDLLVPDTIMFEANSTRQEYIETTPTLYCCILTNTHSGTPLCVQNQPIDQIWTKQSFVFMVKMLYTWFW